jgi:hypothetical protein
MMSEFEEYLTAQHDLQAFHEPRDRAVEAGLCQDPPIGCGLVATAFRDALSAREYQITGLCQSCQDKMYDAEAVRELEEEYLPDDEPPF